MNLRFKCNNMYSKCVSCILYFMILINFPIVGWFRKPTRKETSEMYTKL